MIPSLAQRTHALQPSQTLDVLEKVAALRRQGIKITSFSNRPGTPPEVVEAARAALGESWSAAYTDARGLPALRTAIAAQAARFNSITADPETEILVTIGAKGAIHLAMLALLNPGDEVLLSDPAWVSYEPCIALAGGHIVRYPLREENGYQPDVKDIEARITPRTKMIVINTPHNPTGAVFSDLSLRGIADLAQRENLFVLSDEVYEHFVYDGHKHLSIGALPGMKEGTITISGTSKIFNMFGWRVGWAIADQRIIDAMANIQQNTSACATSFAQAGTVAALHLGIAAAERRVVQYHKARNALVAGLNAIPGVSCHMPVGAYFAFTNVSKLGRNSDEVARILLERGGVQSVAGSAFGPSGEGYIRLIFACTPNDVHEGLKNLTAVLEQPS